MKNIFLLPTDKPSYLFIIDKSKMFVPEAPYLSYTTVGGRVHKTEGSDIYRPQFVYIIDDEKIEDGNWVFQECLNMPHRLIKTDTENVKVLNDLNKCKKIVLTTDQDLIKAGVQSIPDEFLEWFVKNPSCESVDVRKTCCGQCDERLCDVYDTNIGWTKENTLYEIAIPKEEHTTILTANAPLRPPVNLLCGDATSGIEPVRISFNKYIEEQSASVEARLQSAIALLKQTTEYEVLDSFKEKVKQLEIT